MSRKQDLTIRPFDDEGADADKRKAKLLDSRLFKPYFVATLQGSRGSGKSTLALNLIKFYKKFHSNYIFLSPTFRLDEKMVKMSVALIKKGHDVHIYDRVNADSIAEIRELIKELPGNTFLVMDDITGAKELMARNGDLTAICTEARHYKTNILMIVHQYKATPKCFRQNAEIKIFYNLPKGAAKEVFEETGIDIGEELKKLKPREFITLYQRPGSHVFEKIRNLG